MSLQGDRHVRATELRAELPQHLSAAWLTVSVLYFVDLPKLPQPIVALVASTVIGVAGSVLAAAYSHPPSTAPPTAAPTRYPWPAHDDRQYRTPAPPPALAHRRAPVSPADLLMADPPPAADRRQSAGPPAAQPDRELDFNCYRGTGELDIQCPKCGSFEVVVNRSAGTAVDPKCGSHWQWLADPSAPPDDVFVRSWFSP